MNSDSIVPVIYVGKQVWDHFIIHYDSVSWEINTTKEKTAEENYSCGDVLRSKSKSLNKVPLTINFEDGKKQIKQEATFKILVQMNGHALSYFVKLLKLSSLYRKLIIQHLKKKTLSLNKSSHSLTILKIQLIDVDQQIIDKVWNEHLSRLIAEYSELDHAMSWLSTLGGAFSALGDYYLQCAETAGKISLQQFRLALRLGDPNTVARCRLFSALSLMQIGHLKAARQIIWKQYQTIKSGGNGLVPDIRLIRMCHGCWAKLRYEYQQRRHRKQNPKALHWKNK